MGTYQSLGYGRLVLTATEQPAALGLCSTCRRGPCGSLWRDWAAAFPPFSARRPPRSLCMSGACPHMLFRRAARPARTRQVTGAKPTLAARDMPIRGLVRSAVTGGLRAQTPPTTGNRSPPSPWPSPCLTSARAILCFAAAIVRPIAVPRPGRVLCASRHLVIVPLHRHCVNIGGYSDVPDSCFTAGHFRSLLKSFAYSRHLNCTLSSHSPMESSSQT